MTRPSIDRELARRVVATWPGAGLLAGLVLGVVELVALRSLKADVAIAAVGLLVGLGFAIGAAIAAAEAIVATGRPPAAVAPLVRAAPALVPLAHLGRHLFEGSKAATMRGARSAPIWLPLVGYLGVALAIAIGAPLLRGGGRRRRGLLAGALAGAAVVVEGANRRLFVTGYPDVHLFLTVVACALVTIAIGLALIPGRRAPLGPRVAAIGWTVAAALAAAGVIGAFAGGLSSRAGRAVVAGGGVHARQLARVVRGAIDRDDDGFAPVLGGGDCDDADAAINPGAADRPGNGVDEDCDDVDLAAPPPVADDAEVDPAEQWRGSPARGATVAGTRRMNLLLVSVDALRADALVAADAPRLTALADGGARFTHAYAPGAGTDLSLGGLVTGRLDPWQPVERTLPEALRAAGFATHALLPSEVLRYAGRTLLARGFEEVDEIVNDGAQRDVSRETSSIETTDRALYAIDKLRARDQAFVLWVHYFDVHEHLQILESDAALAAVAGDRDLGSRAGKYRALLALVDREAGRLIDGLGERGLAGETIVVVFGDHGESLAEDPRLPDNHGKLVYEPLVRIPFVVVLPGALPVRSTVPVTLLDLPLTLLDLLDQPALPGAWGQSLAPLIVDAPAGALDEVRALPLHESDQWGVVRWPMKLLVRPADNLVELYDLEADPAERRDLASTRPEEVAALKAIKGGWPELDFDRTTKGRARREALARPPASR